MNRIFGWIKRHWLTLAIAVSGILVVGWAGWQGYRASQVRPVDQGIAPPTVAVARGEVVLSVTAPGLSISTNTRILTARVEGSVDEILVQPGETVREGQALARLGERERFRAAANSARLQVYQAQKTLDDLYQNAPVQAAQAQADLAAARFALEEAQEDHLERAYSFRPRASQAVIEAAQQRLTAAVQRHQQAIADYQQALNLQLDDPERSATRRELLNAQQEYANAWISLEWDLGSPSQTEIGLADSHLALVRANLAEAQRAWEAVKDGPDRMALDIAQATLDQAQDDLAKAQADLDSLELAAPFAGLILEVTVQAGQIVGPGTALITLLDPQALQVRATVVEEDLPLVRPGLPVDLFFDALPESNVSGKLDRIVPRRDSDTQAIYPVYITLDRIPEHLAAGMTVDASIVIARQSNVLRLPRAVVHAHSDGTAEVEVWTNGRVEQRVIQVGLRGDSFVEIVDGLGEGELVVAQ
jgi:RND family efflux transporter MFP subunit